MEVWVTVLVGKLEHYGTKVRGERFRCSKQIGEKLAARGVVQIEGVAEAENPTAADGGKSSASPAGLVSQPQTPNASESGETPDEDPPSSEDPPAEDPPKGGKRRGRKATPTADPEE